MSAPNAGGLVGNNTASIAASYATGAVSATASENDDVDAGGLVGSSSGTIMASYATGDATATASGRWRRQRGRSGRQWHRTITASYSTGAPTAAPPTGGLDGDDASDRQSEPGGGLNGAVNANAVNSYWDTDTSGIPATTTATTGVGTSTVALQAP